MRRLFSHIFPADTSNVRTVFLCTRHVQTWQLLGKGICTQIFSHHSVSTYSKMLRKTLQQLYLIKNTSVTIIRHQHAAQDVLGVAHLPPRYRVHGIVSSTSSQAGLIAAQPRQSGRRCASCCCHRLCKATTLFCAGTTFCSLHRLTLSSTRSTPIYFLRFSLSNKKRRDECFTYSLCRITMFVINWCNT